MKANRIISTVGTSLLTGLARPDQAQREEARRLGRAIDDGAWALAATHLRALPPGDPLVGAEINSIQDLLASGDVAAEPACLHFCVSATPDGEKVSAVLEAYFTATRQRVQVHPIDGLQETDPHRFRTQGLRNLVREIGAAVRLAGDPGLAAINATGGFKAQMALAVLVGQALGVSVFYKYERFPAIISFPPLPVTFDYELVGRYGDLLDHLETGALVELPESAVEEPLRVLLEEAPASAGRHVWALAPIGQIYLEGFRQRYPLERTLPPDAAEKRSPSLRDDHYPDGFEAFMRKLWRDQPYVVHCRTLPYDGQPGIRERRFYRRAHDGEIVGEYLDRARFGGRFLIQTTASTPAQHLAVVAHLNQVYGREG